MQYYRCKCGNSYSWTSMGVPACSRCSKCGSDLAMGPTGHDEPKPHAFVTRYNEHTGQPYEQCLQCLRTRAELEAAGEGDTKAPAPVEAVS